MIHFRTDYFRPSWQGGDTQQPICAKPVMGLCCDAEQALPMSADKRDVTCPDCLMALALGLKCSAVALSEFSRGRDSRKRRLAYMEMVKADAPVRYRRDADLKHCLAIHKATQGRMFPFGLGAAHRARNRSEGSRTPSEWGVAVQ